MDKDRRRSGHRLPAGCREDHGRPARHGRGGDPLWWPYLDYQVIYVTRPDLRRDRGVERAALARDLFSYLHMPMVLGIVLLRVRPPATLPHVDELVGTLAAVGLCSGLALYMGVAC